MIHFLWAHFLELTGSQNSASKAYNFWSGFGGDLGFLGVFAIAWRKVNCHEPGCWRLGKHPFEHMVYCRKHHPAEQGATA